MPSSVDDWKALLSPPAITDTYREYDWKLIEEWLHTPLHALSAEQRTALTIVVIGMDADNLERYSGLGYREDHGYHNRPHAETLQSYTLTDTMKAVTQEATELLASPEWGEVSVHQERNLLALQAISANAETISIFAVSDNPRSNNYIHRISSFLSNQPLHLEQDNNGDWHIRIATHRLDTDPTRYKLTELFPLGTYIVAVEESLGVDGRYNWDFIEQLLHTNPNELTYEQILYLLFACFEMDADELMRFGDLGYSESYGLLTKSGYPLISYTQTDTMRLVTQLVIEITTPLAMETVWAYPGSDVYDPRMITQVRNMMALQALSAIADTIPLAGVSANPSSHRYGPYLINTSNFPLHLEQDSSGVWYIRVATGLLDADSSLYEMTAPVKLGTNGVFLSQPQETWAIAEYDFHNMVVGGNLANSLIEAGYGILIDKLVDELITTALRAAPEVVASIATKGVGVGISVFNSIAENARLRNASLRNLAETATYRGLIDLGGFLCYTEIGGIRLLHGINLQTGEAIIKTQGFLNKYRYDITGEQLQMIVLNGKQEQARRALDPDIVGGLTAAQQREVLDEFLKYIKIGGGYYTLLDSLVVLRDKYREEIEYVFADYGAERLQREVFGKSATDWPAEILEFVIAIENNSIPEIEGFVN